MSSSEPGSGTAEPSLCVRNTPESEAHSRRKDEPHLTRVREIADLAGIAVHFLCIEKLDDSPFVTVRSPGIGIRMQCCSYTMNVLKPEVSAVPTCVPLMFEAASPNHVRRADKVLDL